MIVLTAYGTSVPKSLTEKERMSILNDFSNCFSIRNPKQLEFTEELQQLLDKYKPELLDKTDNQ